MLDTAGACSQRRDVARGVVPRDVRPSVGLVDRPRTELAVDGARRVGRLTALKAV